jgi:myo-inositol 2-dehydrogenase/D-chiro-inositol 1-dehydrogenase
VPAFDKVQDLLDSGLCDAVVIATPNFTHIDMMRAALASDLHILIEKPLVTRVEDGLEMLRLAQGRKGIVWVAQEYRYMPPVAEMIRMAHEGAVGVMHQVAIREHREPFYPKVGDWNRFSANTGGTLVEKCCHYFNLMDLILKEKPQRVFASGGQRVNHLDEDYGGRRPDILDSAYVVVEYPSGARALLDLCMFAEGSMDNEHIVVVGDEGQARVAAALAAAAPQPARGLGQPRRLGPGLGHRSRRGRAARLGHQHPLPGQHFGASFIEHQRFAKAVREGLPAEITLEEGLRSVITGLAAHRSIDQGARSICCRGAAAVSFASPIPP